MKTTHNPQIARGVVGRWVAWPLAVLFGWYALYPGPAHGECIDYGDSFHWAGYLEDQDGYADVAVRGTHAFVGGVQVFRVVDVSDPAFPEVLQTLDLPGTGWGVDLYEDYAYVAARDGGLQIFDVDIPAYAYRMGGVATPGDAWDVAVSGGHAYVADGDEGLQVVNVADPRFPEIVGSIDTPGTASALAMIGDHAYVADDGALQVVDISDPTAPQIVGSVPTPGAARDIALSDGYAYVADGSSGIQVIDVSDPTLPQIVATIGAIAHAEGVAVSGDYCLATNGYPYSPGDPSALYVIDISVPALPQMVRSIASPGGAIRVAVSGEQIYVAAGTWGDSGFCSEAGGLQIVHLGGLTDHPPTGEVDTPGVARGVAVAGVYAYVADGSSGLQVIDATTPSAPSIVGNVLTPGVARRVAIVGSYAYVTDGDFHVIDVSDAANPVLTATVNTPGSASQLAVEGARAYVLDGVSSVLIVDVGDPTAPHVLASVELDCPWLHCDGSHIAAEGSFLYFVRYGRTGIPMYYVGSLDVIDVSDPSAPQIVGSRSGLDGACAVTISESFLYVTQKNECWASSTSRLRVIDATDPTSPHCAGTFDLPSAVPGAVDVVNSYAYVSACGLQVFSFDSPISHRPVGCVRSGGSYGMAATADYLFTADGESGLRIYPAHCEEQPVPVLLSGFTAEPQGRAVVLSWFTSFEYLHDGFNVYRSTQLTSDYTKLNDDLIRGCRPYSYLDRSVQPSTTYYYRVGAVDLDGHEVIRATTSATTPTWGMRTALSLGRPSPFRDETLLSFTLAAPTAAELAVYDVSGRLVRVLLRDELSEGEHAVNWDGRDGSGLRVGGGTYFVKLVAGDVTQTRKVVFLGGR